MNDSWISEAQTGLWSLWVSVYLSGAHLWIIQSILNLIFLQWENIHWKIVVRGSIWEQHSKGTASSEGSADPGWGHGLLRAEQKWKILWVKKEIMGRVCLVSQANLVGKVSGELMLYEERALKVLRPAIFFPFSSWWNHPPCDRLYAQPGRDWPSLCVCRLFSIEGKLIGATSVQCRQENQAFLHQIKPHL